MPLFVNGEISPRVFNNGSKLKENNQERFQQNFLQEILDEQQQLSKEVANKLHILNESLTETHSQQSNSYQEISTVLARQEQLTERLAENVTEHKESSAGMDEKLEKLEDMQANLVKTLSAGELTSQAILDHLACQQSMITEISRKLLDYEEATNALKLQAKKQEELHTLFLQQADLQGIFHRTVMERLGMQEAMEENISGQLSDIKSTLTQKGNAIMEKLEEMHVKLSRFVTGILFPNVSKEIKKEKNAFDAQEERKN